MAEPGKNIRKCSTQGGGGSGEVGQKVQQRTVAEPRRKDRAICLSDFEAGTSQRILESDREPAKCGVSCLLSPNRVQNFGCTCQIGQLCPNGAVSGLPRPALRQEKTYPIVAKSRP
jgi:hypothetical protein